MTHQFPSAVSRSEGWATTAADDVGGEGAARDRARCAVGMA
jgi:hypothetical protein